MAQSDGSHVVCGIGDIRGENADAGDLLLKVLPTEKQQNELSFLEYMAFKINPPYIGQSPMLPFGFLEGSESGSQNPQKASEMWRMPLTKRTNEQPQHPCTFRFPLPAIFGASVREQVGIPISLIIVTCFGFAALLVHLLPLRVLVTLGRPSEWRESNPFLGGLQVGWVVDGRAPGQS